MLVFVITQMKSAISNLLVCYWNQNSYSNYWVVGLTFLNLKVFFFKEHFFILHGACTCCNDMLSLLHYFIDEFLEVKNMIP